MRYFTCIVFAVFTRIITSSLYKLTLHLKIHGLSSVLQYLGGIKVFSFRTNIKSNLFLNAV